LNELYKNDIISTLKEEFLPYSAEILINNLPSIQDGLLPVHKKVLWALYQNGVTHNKPFIKMLRASSMAMIYYIFGDMPLGNAMTNMGNNGINYYYLDPKGSFGDKQRRDGVGASLRYIEGRLSEYSEFLLHNIDKNNVQMKSNYDNTALEPIYLPSMIPNILTNTSQSIAVGEASKIPGHNIGEVCDAIKEYIHSKDIEKTIEILKCPDLSLGGKIIYDKETFDRIYKNGRGSFTVVGRYKYNEKENMVSIYEVPYETCIEDIEDKVRACYDKGLFKEITHIHDASGRQGIQLDIYLRKNTDLNMFISKLRKYTPFESKFSCNFTVLDLDCRTPRLMNLEQIISKWLYHRYECIRLETKFDVDKLQQKLHLLYGLNKILLDIDKAYKIVKDSKNDDLVIKNLKKTFEIDDIQAEYVANLKLRNLNKDYIIKRVQDVEDIENEVQNLNSILEDTEKIKSIIVEQLDFIKKKFNHPRKTEIVYEDNSVEIKQESLIQDYTTTLVLTKEGYFKKTQKYSEQQKVKDGDTLLQIIQGSNKDDILFFSNKGNCYKIKAHQIDECTPSSLGEYLPNILRLDSDEIILHMATTNDYNGNMVFVFENGKIAKVEMKSYETKQNVKKLKNALNVESKIVKVLHVKEDIELVLVSSIGKVLIINTNQISVKSKRDSQGVNCMKSKDGSVLKKCYLVEEIVEKGLNNDSIEYYRGNINSVGNFVRKEDKKYFV
jgi:DNA gyrase subunit A